MIRWGFVLMAVAVSAKQNLRYRLTEFDMRVTEAQDERFYGRSRRLGSIGEGEVMETWRNHYVDGAFEIPVVFDEDDEFEGTNALLASDATSILIKMRDMENKLGNVIRFITDHDPQTEFLDGYIRIGHYTSGCWSYVGRLPVSFQPQIINIGDGCDFTDTVEHELMHALGFMHEQARTDRDDHVVVHFDNIDVDKYSNFEKADSVDSRGSPYDRRSVMHYSNYAFALNPLLPSMSSTDTDHPILGGALTMSNADMVQLRMLYRCADGVRSYTDNCVASCPCRLGESTCSGDDGCVGTAECYGGVCELPRSRAPTVEGGTFAPTTTAAPTTTTTAAPTTTTTAAPTTTTNVGLLIGLSITGIILIAIGLFA